MDCIGLVVDHRWVCQVIWVCVLWWLCLGVLGWGWEGEWGLSFGVFLVVLVGVFGCLVWCRGFEVGIYW